MNRSAELQLRPIWRAEDTLIAPGWSPALQFRGSWFAWMRKSERRLSMSLVAADVSPLIIKEVRAESREGSGGLGSHFQQRPDFYRDRFPFCGQLEGQARHDRRGHLNEGGFRQQHLSRLRLGANASGGVDGVAYKPVGLDVRASQQAFNHQPGMQTDADAPFPFAPEPAEFQAQGLCAQDGVARGGKDAHAFVSGIFGLDDGGVLPDSFRGLEVAIEQGHGFLGWMAFAPMGEPADIGKQDGAFLPDEVHRSGGGD